MHVLYNFSLVGMVILDLQIYLSRFCIATQVMALQREISGELFELMSGQGSQGRQTLQPFPPPGLEM